MNTSELTFIAVQAARKAGEILKKGFGTSFKISSKPGRQNLVTEYDKSAEQAIKTIILKPSPPTPFWPKRAAPMARAPSSGSSTPSTAPSILPTTSRSFP